MTSAKVKRHSSAPRGSARPGSAPSDDADQLKSTTRIKRAAIHPASEREAVEASLDAALRELDSLEAVPKKKATDRRVPPFPGTGRTRAVPMLPSMRPKRSLAPKKGG